jgi:hypothetical protein
MKKHGSALSRRKMLAITALGVGGLGAMAASALNRNWFVKDGRGRANWWNRQNRALASAGLNEWSAQLGSAFEFQTESGASMFKLVAVTPLLSSGARSEEVTRDRAFLAVFQGTAASTTSGNRIYATRHATGALDIFVGATDLTGTRPTLNAVFN